MKSETAPPKPYLLKGISLSPGVAVGTCFRAEPRATVFYRTRIEESEVDAELRRLHLALEATRRDLMKLKGKFQQEGGREPAYILDAYLLILDDRQFLDEIQGRIAGRLESPEKALRTVTERWLDAYRKLNDSFFRERGSDFEEIVERIINHLIEGAPVVEGALPDDLILVAPELGLSLLVNYPLERVKGLVLTNACPTSHVTIIARSYQIPLVAGIGPIDSEFQTGELILVDGFRGVVEKNLEINSAAVYRTRIEQEKKRHSQPVGDREPCLTADGRRIFLYANTEVGAEVSAALKLGAEGIGLFRSEYIFMQSRRGGADEETQYSIYKTLAESVGDLAGVIRTLDLSEAAFTLDGTQERETSAALGVRGIRLSLRKPQLFRSQIRAILRAGRHGNLRIALPMVSSLDEVLQARTLIRQAQSELVEEGISVAEISMGIMLEVPAALLILEDLLAHVDFIAVGTNDLIQYTLAASRVDEKIAYLYNPLHPAVLRSLYQTIQVCEAASVTALVCGEMAGHPVFSLILVGLGFRHLSMNPFNLQKIKKGIRRREYSRLREAALELTRLKTAGEIREFVEEKFGPGQDLDPGSSELHSHWEREESIRIR